MRSVHGRFVAAMIFAGVAAIGCRTSTQPAHTAASKPVVATDASQVGTRALPPMQARSSLVPLQPIMRPLGCPDICVSVTGLTGAQIGWALFTPLPGTAPVTGYAIRRYDSKVGDVLVTTVPAGGALSYADTSLRDNTTYQYVVNAVGAPTTINCLPTQHCNGPVTSPVPALLHASGTATVTTPPLLTPASLSVVADANQVGLIHVTWPAVPFVGTYGVVRDGPSNPIWVTSAGLDDSPPPGWHTYTVFSAATEQGMGAQSPLTGTVTIHTGQMHMLAFGDSVMWGQGLHEVDKFDNQVRNWLSGSLGMPVAFVSLAHSGAVIDVPASAASASATAAQNLAIANASGVPNQFGEIPNSYPTVNYQAFTMGPTLGDPRSVDLILVDGCYNDIGITTILDPRTSDAALNQAALNACGGQVVTMLQQLATTYPRAHVVLTGYYQEISNQSDLGLLNLYATGVGVPASAILSVVGLPLIGFPIDPVTGAIGGAIAVNIAVDAYRGVAIDHTMVANNAITALLSQGVAAVRPPPGTPVPLFAALPLGPSNAYGTQNSWLWQVPVPPDHVDDMFTLRQNTCAVAAPVSTSYTPGPGCWIASSGHPNKVGALTYAQTIQGLLQPALAPWRASLAPAQHWP